MKALLLIGSAALILTTEAQANTPYYKKYSAIDDPAVSLYEDHYVESLKQTDLLSEMVRELRAIREELDKIKKENHKLREAIVHQQKR